MATFSKQSREKLATCHPDLVRVFERVIQEYDCVVLEGQRTLERQEKLFAEGKSRTMNSKHLSSPSMAVDVAPYPIDWDDRERFLALSLVVGRVAKELGIKIRWGGTFKGFYDAPHYELVGK